MEYIQSVWLVIVISLAAGAVIGIVGYRLFAPSLKEADKVKTELDAVKEEMANYKASVNQHFDKTSELVGDLTQSYVKVYQHLAEGSQALGGSKAFTNLLEQHQGKELIAGDDDSIVVDEIAGDMVGNAAVEAADKRVESSEGEASGETEPVTEEGSSVKADTLDSADNVGNPTEASNSELSTNPEEDAPRDFVSEADVEKDEADSEREKK